MLDKFHEECGVVAIYGHPEAAKLAYLGLYALQHRGQESAGICTSDGNLIYTHKEMGHVADIFTKPVLATLPGELAIGHTRYSTAGDTVLLNAQPFSVSCKKGRLAVAHNGNITNTAELREELGRLGSVFQASSDTELVLHLVAHSSERTLAGALREALLQVEGAFSLVLLAQDRILVARDPHGFRPMAVGEMEVSGGRKCYVFASETCAFDLIGAVYLHDVEPGEMVEVGPEGMTRQRYAPEQQRAQCVFEHVYFARPDSIVFGRSVEESRENLGRRLARECPADADLVVPVPAIVNSELAKKHATAADPWALEWTSRNDAGGGAFRVETWTPGQQTVFTRFDAWKSGPLPKLKKVIYRQIASAGTRRALLEKGDVDISVGLPPKDYAELAKEGKVQVIGTLMQNEMFHVDMNVTMKPFGKPASARSALALARSVPCLIGTGQVGSYGLDGSPSYIAVARP